MNDENERMSVDVKVKSDADFIRKQQLMHRRLGECMAKAANEKRAAEHKDKVDAMTFKLLSILKADRFTDNDIVDVIAKMNTLIVVPCDENNGQ